ncbi:hypothetical protein HERIO_2524 [Hepatospora eriocheir]|uniref:Uncharacterized protein n=1 Tax=Hepatospora eriocheir TaxID=1081669 RepID=A0A1X0Q6K9_9MICR|nr:hypothetical protein HERIO_2524 [Hepatospora eriocheir]
MKIGLFKSKSFFKKRVLNMIIIISLVIFTVIMMYVYYKFKIDNLEKKHFYIQERLKKKYFYKLKEETENYKKQFKKLEEKIKMMHHKSNSYLKIIRILLCKNQEIFNKLIDNLINYTRKSFDKSDYDTFKIIKKSIYTVLLKKTWTSKKMKNIINKEIS